MKHFCVLQFVLVLMSSTCSNAFAQTVKRPPNDADAPVVEGQQDIIVTATRRSSSLQEVPAAVSALGTQEITARGIKDTEDLQFAVPSLAVGTQNGITAIAIRGIGLNQRQGAPGVGVYVDGVYQPHPALGDITEVDLERVEVLRGPQGTLYGRNTTGGAVSFISKAPSQDLSGYVMAGAATYDEYRLQGVVNIPLGKTWAVRAVADYDDRGDGFIRNVVPGQADVNSGRVWSGRVRLTGKLTSNLRLDLLYTGQRVDGPFDYLALSNVPSPIAVGQSPVLATAIVTTEKFRTSANSASDTSRNYNVYAGVLTWSSPLGEVKSTTSYQNYREKTGSDLDGTNLPFTIADTTSHVTSWVHETVLASKVGPLDTVAGLFLMWDSQIADNGFIFPLGFGALPPSGRLDVQEQRYLTRAYAGFVDGTLKLTPKLRLIGGVRYSVDTQDVRAGTMLSLVTPLGSVPLAPLCPTQTDHLKFESFTPRGGVQYDVSNNINAYGTVSRGFKSGGVNISSCGNTYEPEKITAYEFGLKTRLFNRQLTLNASAFYYDYTNIQIEQFVSLQSLITNAAAATIKGIELEGIFTPDQRWNLNANITYLDARYDHFSDTDTLNPLAGVQVLDGNRLNYSPKWSVNAGVSYTTGKARWGSLQGRVDLSYRSRVYFRPFNAPLDSQSPYALANLNLAWTAPAGRFVLRLYVNNVTNRGYVVSGGSADTLGARSLYWGVPRQAGAELRVNF